MVLIAGLLLHFFRNSDWVKYIDPVTSLIVVALILWTTIPLGEILELFWLIFFSQELLAHSTSVYTNAR